MSAQGFVANVRPDIPIQPKARNSQDASEPGRKRRRTAETGHEVKLEGDRRHSDQPPPAALDHSLPDDRFNSTSNALRGAPQRHASFSQSPASATSAPFPSGPPKWSNIQTESPTASQSQYAASTYLNPHTFDYPAPDNILPNFPLDSSDPVQWSNFDFNMADVFESATWENLVGSTEPDVSQWNFPT